MLDREPVILAAICVVLLTSTLAGAVRLTLGRPLEWGEMIALFSAVSALVAPLTRSLVSPVAKESAK